jgi:hypothetical protein
MRLRTGNARRLMRAQTGEATKRESRLDWLECGGRFAAKGHDSTRLFIFKSALLDLYFILLEFVFFSRLLFGVAGQCDLFKISDFSCRHARFLE